MLDVGKPSAKTGDLLEGMEATEPLIEKHCKVEILLGVHMYIYISNLIYIYVHSCTAFDFFPYYPP